MVNNDIEKKATAILEETDLGSILPVNILALAQFYGFSVYASVLDDSMSGLIMVDEKPLDGYASNKVIVVNAHHSPRRKRFTIAHELGHYFLNNRPKQCYAHRDIAGAYNSEERDANQFASALLMPKDQVLECIQNHSLVGFDELVEFVSNLFNVSEDAARVRLSKLGLLS